MFDSFILCVCALFLLILSASICSADDETEESRDNLLKMIGDGFGLAHHIATRRNYIDSVEILKAWRDRVSVETDEGAPNQVQMALNQSLTTVLSYIGDYQGILKYPVRMPDHSVPEIGSFQLESAIEVVDAQMAEHRIVMINEAHHIPHHRKLTKRLLPKLWKAGYRYLAIEALSESHSANELGYALSRAVYLNEPLYGELVREAKRIGFNLVAYDTSFGPDREEVAAKNIHNQTFSIDPKARVVVHCGYSHIHKQDGWLGEQLMNVTGHEPLSINQATYLEHADPAYEDLIYRQVADELVSVNAVDRGLKGMPVALKMSDGSYWSGDNSNYDISVFWPRVAYRNGRPAWQLEGHEHAFFDPEWCDRIFPCLVEVDRVSEVGAVAFDRVVVKEFPESDEPVAVRIPSQQHTIRTFNHAGEPLRIIVSE